MCTHKIAILSMGSMDQATKSPGALGTDHQKAIRQSSMYDSKIVHYTYHVYIIVLKHQASIIIHI